MPEKHGRTAFVRLVRRIQGEYRQRKSWRAVGALYGVSGASARNVAYGREPRSARLRRAFGLPLYATVEVCAHCGEAHKAYKVCPKDSKPRAPRRRWPQLLIGRPEIRRLSDEEVAALKIQ